MSKISSPIVFTFLLVLVSSCTFFDCGNDIYSRINNGTNKVVKFSRDCGATTSASIQISVLPIHEQLSDDDGGNIFICEGYIGDSTVKVSWIDDTSILISYSSKLEVFKRDSLVNGINIVYKIKEKR